MANTGITRRVFWILAGSGSGAVSAIVLLAVSMAKEADELARDTVARLVGSALNAEVDRIALSTGDYAHSDEAVGWIMARNDEAVRANLGTGGTKGPTFDFIFVTSPGGVPIYAFGKGGEVSDLSRFDPVAVAATLATVADLPLEPYRSVASFARFGDRIAILGAGRVQPFGASDLSTAELPVMFAGAWLDEARLREIGADILVTELSVSPAGRPRPPDTSGWALHDVDGNAVAEVNWPAPRPGREMLSRALPVIAATSFLLFAGVFVVGRASAKQSAGYVRERLRARTDGLTGLMNRAGLTELVASPPIAGAIRRGAAAVVYLDLDGFKALNDEAGHDGGDRALIVTAERLRRSVRHADTIARLGGDEFVVLILDPVPEEAARAVCDRVLMQTGLPIRIGASQYLARPSIGAAVAGEGAEWDELLIRADAAMYRAKRNRTGKPVYDFDVEGSETKRDAARGAA